MTRYASETSVSQDRSRAEIERTLQRYGADMFSYGWKDEGDESFAYVMFRMANRHIRFVLRIPSRSAKEFQFTEQGRKRKPDAALKEWEQSVRQRWRALALVVKAKLEAVESGITTFEDEFMAHIVLPNGQTVGEYMVPQIAEAYESKKMPKLLAWNG